jgi:hypothetical protein
LLARFAVLLLRLSRRVGVELRNGGANDEKSKTGNAA